MERGIGLTTAVVLLLGAAPPGLALYRLSQERELRQRRPAAVERRHERDEGKCGKDGGACEGAAK